VPPILIIKSGEISRRWAQATDRFRVNAGVVERTGCSRERILRLKARLHSPASQKTQRISWWKARGPRLGSDQPEQIVPQVAHDYASRHSVYQLTISPI